MPRPLPDHVLPVPAGWRSREMASFVAQLDALSTTMFADLRGITARELAWQPRLGANSIGMLLAHIAVVEVWWTLVAQESASFERLRAVLGIDMDDDGLPLKPNGRPPAKLRGKTLAYFRKLHDRARAFARRGTKAFTPAMLDRPFVRTRLDGRKQRTDRRWIYYHVLEHQAGHYGQVLLLRHLYRDRRRRG